MYMIMIRYHTLEADGVDDVNGHECCPSFHGLWMMMVDGWMGGWVAMVFSTILHLKHAWTMAPHHPYIIWVR